MGLVQRKHSTNVSSGGQISRTTQKGSPVHGYLTQWATSWLPGHDNCPWWACGLMQAFQSPSLGYFNWNGVKREKRFWERYELMAGGRWVSCLVEKLVWEWMDKVNSPPVLDFSQPHFIFIRVYEPILFPFFSWMGCCLLQANSSWLIHLLSGIILSLKTIHPAFCFSFIRLRLPLGHNLCRITL